MAEKPIGKVPDNHVVAVISGSKSAQALRDELKRGGYEETVVFRGEEVSLAMDAKGEHSNLLGQILKAVQDHLSEEPNYRAQYEEEARNGNQVIAVRVNDLDDARLVAEVLERYGARNVRFFGKLQVADLSPATNPTARSADSPERWSNV
jgi:hypothetical protein